MAGPISQRFIDDLLARVDIAELIGERVTLKKSGRNLLGLCPFHDEKSPSFNVSREKQFYHCFGCGASGNAVRFLMEYDRLSFPEAIEHLAERQGLEVERDEETITPAQKKQRAIKHQQQEQGVNLLELSARWFVEQLALPHAEAARVYLGQRGLDASIIETFGIGYSPDSWDALKHHLGQHGVATSVQVEYGLQKMSNDNPDRTYDLFRDRVMFPIRDWKGRTIGFGGRVLGDAKPKYLNSPETPVFHKGRELYGLYEARQQNNRLDSLLIVEGYMDVVALAQSGIHHAVATLGTAITPEHLQRIFRLVDEVVFCFDGDSAGKRAAQKALDTALPSMIDGRQARFLFLPETDDPDSLVRREGRDAFVARVENASPLSEFIFDLAREGVDLKQVEGRERFVTQVLGRIRHVPEGVLRSLLMAELAQRSGIDAQELHTLLLEGQHTRPYERNMAVEAPHSGSSSGKEWEQGGVSSSSRKRTESRTSLCTRMLHMLLHSPELVSVFSDDVSWVPASDDGPLLVSVIRLLRAGRTKSTQLVLARFHDTPEGMRLLALARKPPMIPVDAREAEMNDYIHFLKRQHERLSPEEEYHRLLAQSKRGELEPAQKQRLLQLIMALQ
ncbi:DNA primase [Halomonadaceae bacterium LMG 33818]|uniref:DNA primase n=1 Tax=Cernens ardua TaxID=3402176 RepID=UPI003EDBDA60